MVPIRATDSRTPMGSQCVERSKRSPQFSDKCAVFFSVLFTGGSRVGKIVATAAAKHLTPLTLEVRCSCERGPRRRQLAYAFVQLGGKNPVVIDPRVDINLAARRILWGRFSNAGQVRSSLHPPTHESSEHATHRSASRRSTSWCPNTSRTRSSPRSRKRKPLPLLPSTAIGRSRCNAAGTSPSTPRAPKTRSRSRGS